MFEAINSGKDLCNLEDLGWNGKREYSWDFLDCYNVGRPSQSVSHAVARLGRIIIMMILIRDNEKRKRERKGQE